MRGVDNIRHDVALSARFMESTRNHIFRLITRHGQIEPLVDEAPTGSRPLSRVMLPGNSVQAKVVDAIDFKRALLELHIATLNRAKTESNISIDLVGRLAIIKFQRNELAGQFAQALERSRAKLKTYDGPRQALSSKAVELRDRFARFQINKKAVLRKVGQDLFSTIREIEKETI